MGTVSFVLIKPQSWADIGAHISSFSACACSSSDFGTAGCFETSAFRGFKRTCNVQLLGFGSVSAGLLALCLLGGRSYVAALESLGIAHVTSAHVPLANARQRAKPDEGWLDPLPIGWHASHIQGDSDM